ncbi:MAG TPA: site-specific integrase [Nitrososphaeraceae archaeon]|jgi:site-specific recombinase XerD
MVQAQKQQEVQQQEDILVGDSYLNFINSLKSDSTKECYTNALKRFMTFCEIKDTDTLATLTPSELEFYLKRYLENQKETGSSYNSMSMITSP